MGTQAGGRWVDLKDAAEILDTTTEAVSKQAKRGTLPSTTEENGRLYVRVDGQVDDWVDARVDGEARLVEREANRENRRIIAGFVQRVPELEPAVEASSEA